MTFSCRSGIAPGKPNGMTIIFGCRPTIKSMLMDASDYCIGRLFLLRRKEVIHPLVLEGIPCFDLTPITRPALDAALLTVRLTLLGLSGSHGVTGSVYKARERIHRDNADSRLLAIPAS